MVDGTGIVRRAEVDSGRGIHTRVVLLHSFRVLCSASFVRNRHLTISDKTLSILVEILAEYFGWEPTYYGYLWGDNGKMRAGIQHFSMADIGKKEYRKTMATLSRSVTRLEQRGLVTVLVGVHSQWTATVGDVETWKAIESLADFLQEEQHASFEQSRDIYERTTGRTVESVWG